MALMCVCLCPRATHTCVLSPCPGRGEHPPRPGFPEGGVRVPFPLHHHREYGGRLPTWLPGRLGTGRLNVTAALPDPVSLPGDKMVVAPVRGKRGTAVSDRGTSSPEPGGPGRMPSSQGSTVRWKWGRFTVPPRLEKSAWGHAAWGDSLSSGSSFLLFGALCAGRCSAPGTSLTAQPCPPGLPCTTQSAALGGGSALSMGGVSTPALHGVMSGPGLPGTRCRLCVEHTSCNTQSTHEEPRVLWAHRLGMLHCHSH